MKKQILNEQFLRMQKLAGINLNENNTGGYDLVSQFKLNNKYLKSLGLDEDGIETLQIWINLMKSDKNWFNKTFPQGSSYVDLISNISDKVKDLPSFIKKNKSINPVKIVNSLKG